MWHFLASVELADLIESIDTGRKPSMEREDLILNNSSEREIVKEVGEVFPHISIAVFPQTLVIEAVDLSDLATFVVSSEDGDTVRKAHFQRDQETDSLD